jgi:hypothetical protein
VEVVFSAREFHKERDKGDGYRLLSF